MCDAETGQSSLPIRSFSCILLIEAQHQECHDKAMSCVATVKRFLVLAEQALFVHVSAAVTNKSGI